jgi:hypothetical protein
MAGATGGPVEDAAVRPVWRVRQLRVAGDTS